jgi:hypothetical protein
MKKDPLSESGIPSVCPQCAVEGIITGGDYDVWYRTGYRDTGRWLRTRKLRWRKGRWCASHAHLEADRLNQEIREEKLKEIQPVIHLSHGSRNVL